MSKYELAKTAVHDAVDAGKADGHAADEMLLALLVSTVAEYRAVAGAEATASALSYELGELDGSIDTQFIRSR